MSASGDRVIRVGSRKSELALIQTREVISALEKLNPLLQFEIGMWYIMPVTMSTLGDQILDIPLPKIGEKSLFTKELEIALQAGAVDFLVHSLKDLPTTLPDGMVIGAVLEREDPRDALVLRQDLQNLSLETLPRGSIIGTSSLRRTAQLAKKYPHLKVENIRGNLNTRLRKLDELGNFQAIILAAAGLQRMGWNHRISKILDEDDILYAVGQGALAVECRDADIDTINLLGSLYEPQTALRVISERSFLKTLGGGCSAPVAVCTNITTKENSQYTISIKGAVWSLDGKQEVIDTDQSEIEIKNCVRCSVCPYGLKNFDSNANNDMECVKDCTYKRISRSESEDVSTTKKVKLNESNCADKVSKDLLLENDPHEHCPVTLPVGVDFMGKCPYLESNLDGNHSEHSIQLTGKDVTKCPFLKDELSLQSLDKVGSNLTASSTNGVKAYAGLVTHTNIPQWALDEAVELGVRLANKLIKNGAVEIMTKAQSVIRGTS